MSVLEDTWHGDMCRIAFMYHMSILRGTAMLICQSYCQIVEPMLNYKSAISYKLFSSLLALLVLNLLELNIVLSSVLDKIPISKSLYVVR